MTHRRMEQLTQAEAIAMAKSGAWEEMSLLNRARFQLEQRFLCMPFDAFHHAVEHALSRPVYTHEFADPARLRDELYERKPKATLAEILALVPVEKRLVLRKKDV